VLSIEDGALVEARLIPQRFVDNWVPPDMLNSIPKEWQNPLVQIWDAKVVAYNPEAYGACPINNIWDLTDPKWRGKVALRDPLDTPEEITWFSWLTTDDNARKLAAAYQQRYGNALQTREKNAGYEFIVRLAANQPIVTKSDNDSASSVGAPGQKEAPVGIMSLGKFSEAPPQGEKLAPCKSIRPWIGYAYPRYAVIVHNTPSPNAAKLYVHYLMTAEGAAPTINQHGGFSANLDVAPGRNEHLGPREFWEKNLIFLTPGGNDRAWQMRERLSDLWRLNRK
jgi:iron(III) transport system substrate-binding protein